MGVRRKGEGKIKNIYILVKKLAMKLEKEKNLIVGQYGSRDHVILLLKEWIGPPANGIWVLPAQSC